MLCWADRPLGLSRPQDPTAVFRDGRLTSTHLRAFSEPVSLAAQDLVVQVYDPSFYSAYVIAATPVLTGAPAACVVQVFEPDRDVADARLAAAIAELAGSPDADEGEFPAIGDAYAEEARITCPVS